jgi:preprotein translocase subunit SecE
VTRCAEVDEFKWQPIKRTQSVADKEEVDSTDESSDPSADLSSDGVDGADASFRSYPAEAGDGSDDDQPSDPPTTESPAKDGSRDPAAINGVEEDLELVSVGASPTTRAASASSESAALAASRAKKHKATPKQKQPTQKEARTGPIKFLKESVAELQKVVYPTGQQLINYFIVVLIFVLFIIAIVSLLDLAFGAAIIRIFS